MAPDIPKGNNNDTLVKESNKDNVYLSYEEMTAVYVGKSASPLTKKLLLFTVAVQVASVWRQLVALVDTHTQSP